MKIAGLLGWGRPTHLSVWKIMISNHKSYPKLFTKKIRAKIHNTNNLFLSRIEIDMLHLQRSHRKTKYKNKKWNIKTENSLAFLYHLIFFCSLVGIVNSGEDFKLFSCFVNVKKQKNITDKSWKIFFI